LRIVAARTPPRPAFLLFAKSKNPQNDRPKNTPPVNPGDLLYFPDRYWHATVNLDPYTAFVSSFTTEHGAAGAGAEPLGDEL
jgi:hypothetical protein